MYVQTFYPPPRTQHISLIHKFIEFYKLWHGCVQHIPQASRYTLGNKIDNLCLETLELIFIASHLPKSEKISYVNRANQKLDLLKFFLQISWEINAIDTNKYTSISDPLGEIGRMLGGWIRQLELQTRPLSRE